MATSLSHKYYGTTGQPWLVISIQTGSDAVARAMMPGNKALVLKRRPTAAQASSRLQETVFHLYLYISLNCEVLYTEKVIAFVVVYFHRALAVRRAGMYKFQTPTRPSVNYALCTAT
jgi:hypothetical protein